LPSSLSLSLSLYLNYVLFVPLLSPPLLSSHFEDIKLNERISILLLLLLLLLGSTNQYT
jgi:hypothetical protein